MPITIWKPREYGGGFSYHGGAGGTLPINGEAADAPFDRDTKVREVARFTGWKKTYFCDTGEFEITTQAVTPDDVKAGFMVDIEGEQFVIEDVRWEYGDDGYSCTFSGRDFWKFPENQIAHRWIGESFHITGYDDEFTGETLARAVSDWFTTMAAGWWRDRLRFPNADAGVGWQDWNKIVRFDLSNTTQAAVLAKTLSANVTDIMSYASEWRMFCNWFGVGLRFDFEFDEIAGVYLIKPVFYDGKDRGIVVNTTDRGVSGFEYEKNTRGTVNAAFCMFESNYTYSPVNVRDYVADDYQGYLHKPETDKQILQHGVVALQSGCRKIHCDNRAHCQQTDTNDPQRQNTLLFLGLLRSLFGSLLALRLLDSFLLLLRRSFLRSSRTGSGGSFLRHAFSCLRHTLLRLLQRTLHTLLRVAVSVLPPLDLLLVAVEVRDRKDRQRPQSQRKQNNDQRPLQPLHVVLRFLAARRLRTGRRSLPGKFILIEVFAHSFSPFFFSLV